MLQDFQFTASTHLVNFSRYELTSTHGYFNMSLFSYFHMDIWADLCSLNTLNFDMWRATDNIFRDWSHLKILNIKSIFTIEFADKLAWLTLSDLADYNWSLLRTTIALFRKHQIFREKSFFWNAKNLVRLYSTSTTIGLCLVERAVFSAPCFL